MATGVTTQVGRVVWHELVTTDVERAKTFYTALLGWEIETWKPGELDYAMISVGGQTHGGFQAAQGGAPPHWLGHIQVEDADAAAATATGLGATVIAGPLDVPDVGRFIVIADPQGAVCSLYRPAGEGPSTEGVFLWDELLASDVEAAKAFYGAVVGWTTADMDMGDMVYTIFKRAGDVDAGGCMPKPADMPIPAAWMTYLATPDVDATVARAAELGGSVVGPPFDVAGVGRLAIIADPTGAVVGLFAPTPR
jgi:predicted enzyme related to lactoylglutathione lyase